MKKFIVFFAAAVVSSAAFAQNPLPNDPAVKVGKLDNGMTYYIRHNDKPAQRAEFYLATHAGAIQETPDQDGLAHFLEHMCFNGLKNLPGKQMLEYLQRIGAEFGRNINTSTGVEATQYMLNNIPVTREGIIDTCLLVMHDYSHFVLNDPVEIDKERGVIIEERRTRRNASWRMYEKNKNYLFKGSKYADCTLIGSQENLETFKPQSLVDFYQTWYRPDNQALIVVGDIDVDRIEAKIKDLFADIPAPVDPKAKDVIRIPGNKEPIVGIVTDPEASNSVIEFVWKGEPLPVQMNNTDVAFTMNIIKSIISIVMNERLSDIASKPDAPFLDAGFGVSSLCETCEAVLATAAFKDGEYEKAAKAILLEVEKMKRFAFTESEIQRAKDEVLSRYEKAAQGAESRKNGDFIRPLIANFNLNHSYLEPATALQIAQMVLPQIQPAMFSQMLPKLVSDENLVILFNGPEKDGVKIPAECELLSIYESVKSAEIQAPVEEQVASDFVDPASLKGAKVKKTATIATGATQWTLANGVTVAVLPTDYKKDQVLISLVMDGGSSLIPDSDVYSFDENVLAVFGNNSGVGEFPKNTVSKMLSGKQVNISPFIEPVRHGISGGCQPKDIETALQLVYLYFTQPRFDADEWNLGMNQLRAVLPNVLNTPEFKFQNEMVATVNSNKARNPQLTMENLEKASLDVYANNYRKLFKTAAGAKVIIVGNVELESLKPLVEKYIGSLPKGRKALRSIDVKDDFVQGAVKNHFKVDMQTPKSSILQLYNTYDIEYSIRKSVLLSAASNILDMIYTDSLREEEGGTYGASTNITLKRYPKPVAYLQVYFDTNPSSATKLAGIAMDGLRKLAEEGPTAEQFTRVKENFAKNVPEKRITNGYWVTAINYWYFFGKADYDAQYQEAVASMTPEGIRDALREILASGNSIELMMSPDKAAEAE